MAASSLRMLVAIAIIAIAVVSIPTPALATDFMVGDDSGWILDFDYQGWAAGKEFLVGDRLIFNYPQGAHNVIKVNETGFQQCTPPANAIPLATGNDIIPLEAPGKKWYICGVGKDCAAGNMKLAITVLPQVESPAASPSTGRVSSGNSSSKAAGIAVSKYYAWIVGVFSILVMIMA